MRSSCVLSWLRVTGGAAGGASVFGVGRLSG